MNLGIPHISTYEQAAMFDPSNPNQREVNRYTQVPGGYSTFYYNRVPTTAQMQGVGLGAGVWDGLGTVGQSLVVGIVGLAVGFFGYKKVGPMLAKKSRR
jgi:hypothetical protein